MARRLLYGLSKARPLTWTATMEAAAAAVMRVTSNSSAAADFNAAVLIAEFRLVERTLLSLQRNLDDFYFVTLTAITFGNIHPHTQLNYS